MGVVIPKQDPADSNTVVMRPPGRFTAEVDQIGESAWNSVLNGFSGASVYQTWAYGSVCWGERQLSHLVLRQDGSPIAGAQVRIVGLPVLHSGIAYVRWGPIGAWQSGGNTTVWRAMTEALIDEYAVRRGLMLRIVPNVFEQDPEADAIASLWSELGLVEETSVRKYQTLRIDLRLALDVMRRRLSSRWRRQLNIAERNSLEIVEGQSVDLYRQFLGLYREMRARKEFETTVDINDFERIQQRLPEAQKMLIFICLTGGRPAAGLVVDVVGKTAIYLLAATGDDGLQARGSYLLQWHAMERLKQRGCEWYDLGGVNQEVNPGVFVFKSGMGGEPVSQLGRFCLSRSCISSVSVSIGERLHRIARTFSRSL